MRGLNTSEKALSKRNTNESRRRPGFDPLPSEGRIYQKNEGGWNFRLSESECKSKVVLDVPVGRYMDISLIDIDVQPTWVRVLVKGKLLQLLLPEEVNPDASVAQRSATTGNLLISMPKASANVRVNVQNCKTSPVFYSELPTELKAKGKAGSQAYAAEKELLDAPTLIQERDFDDSRMLEIRGVQQTELLDERNFDDLPALE